MITKVRSTVYLLLFCVTTTFSQTGKLAFIQNKGQWDPKVSYKTDFPGGQALATSEGMMVGVFDMTAVLARVEWGNKIEENETGAQYLMEHPKAPNLKGHGWRFHFLNGNASPTIESKVQSKDFYNFWVGDASHHASKVRSYEEITYKDIYNDIDVRYYTSSDGNLENDIIIKPFADITNLAFELEGIDEIKQNQSGDLILTTSIGEVSIPAPVSYLIDEQGITTPIQIRFVLNSKTIQFDIPTYDNSQTLVIDPIVLRWATWATNASSADTHNHGTGLDSLGNLYIAGRINATGLITVGAFDSIAGGSMDLMISKYTEPATPGGSGSRIWQTYLGGPQTDNCIGIQMGSDGYAYIAAYTPSDIPTTFGTGFTAGTWIQRTGNAGTFIQALIIKLDLAGNGALTREIGSVAKNYAINAADIRVLKTGVSTYDLIFSGFIDQPASTGVADGDMPAPQTPAGTNYTQPGSKAKNAIVMRITNTFDSIYWVKNIGSDLSSAKDDAVKISTVDAAGNIYLAGYTKATANISYNNPSSQISRIGSQDGWIMKMNNGGTVQWSRYYNSSSSRSSTILSMELNRADTNLIIAGITTGLATANITTGTVQTTLAGGQDLFVAKISKTGSMTNWGTYFGGSATEDNMMGLNTDQNDDIYFLGYTNSTNYPTNSNPIQSTNYGGYDAVFTKLNSSGTAVLYSTYYGGSTDDDDPLGQRGILFNNCRIYLSVTACSNNVPLTSSAITTNKVSSTSIPEPVIVSMANPPDLNNTTISSPQTIACGQTPTPLTANTATYNIAPIIRNGVTQTTGTMGSYSLGVPVVSGYQWQESTDYTFSWTNIAGANSPGYSPPALFQTTYFRRIVSGDYCTHSDSNLAIIVSGGPNIFPTITCAGSTVTFFANAVGGSGSNTYEWSGPLAFYSTAQDPMLTSATNANNGYYSCTVTASNVCKNTKVLYLDFNSCTYSVVLSVALLNFNAEKSGATSTLTWQTANEHKSEAFIIERSLDGTQWETIGSVDANGTSSKIIGYKFIDKNPVIGINYYRLKITENTGGIKYSEMKNLFFSKQNAVNIVNILPNPFANFLSVTYSLPNRGEVLITIMDAQGRILSSHESSASKGTNTMKFNTTNYAKGLYFITVNYNGMLTNYKMIVKE